MTDKVVMNEEETDEIPLAAIKDVAFFNDLDEIRTESETIVNDLLQDGASPEEVIEIEHFFACTDFNKLEKFVVEIDGIFGENIDIGDAEETEDVDGSTIFTVDFASWHKIDADEIMQEIEKFIPVCNQYDVVYDSWGTQLDDEEDLEEDETALDDK